MSDLVLATEAQMRRIEPYFLCRHGVARSMTAGDQRHHFRHQERVCAGAMRRVSMVRTRPSTIGSCAGAAWCVQQDIAELARKGSTPKRLMIDATHLKAHRTAASLLKKGLFPTIGRTKGGLNSKLHAVCDGQGRPVIMLLSEGQISDYKGAAFRLSMRCRPRSSCSATRATTPAVRQALAVRGITACIPSSPTAQSRST